MTLLTFRECGNKFFYADNHRRELSMPGRLRQRIRQGSLAGAIEFRRLPETAALGFLESISQIEQD